MQRRTLGPLGLSVSAIGLGCMGMSEFYGLTDERESLATLERALELGIDFWDTADVYGPHTNEELIGRALVGRRDRVTLATKFGLVRGVGDEASVRESGTLVRLGVRGDREYVRACCEASLRRLNTDYIDLYFQHRVDPDTPIEETVGAMSELVAEGKVRYIGLSEAGAETIRRAHAVHPISAVQSEWSLWTRDIEARVLPALRELGIGIVAYSPLGRGFLTGRIQKPDDLAPDDFRRKNPRFEGDNFDRNLLLAEAVQKMARAKNITPAQLALAWVMSRGDDVVPIPGTKRRTYLEDNAGAADVELTSEHLATIDAFFSTHAASGERYADMSAIER